MKIVNLNSAQRQQLPDNSGGLGTALGRSEYNYPISADEPWYDAERESGARAEVKTTLERLKSGASGRFRLWQEQHEKLTAYDRENSARYIFVLVDEAGTVARLVRKRPSTIGRLIAVLGGWGASGHDMGKQFKLHHRHIF